jgi:hypothetical protein
MIDTACCFFYGCFSYSWGAAVFVFLGVLFLAFFLAGGFEFLFFSLVL